MPNLIRDTAEEVLKNFLLSIVFRLTTGEGQGPSPEREAFFDLPEGHQKVEGLRPNVVLLRNASEFFDMARVARPEREEERFGVLRPNDSFTFHKTLPFQYNAGRPSWKRRHWEYCWTT
jgi:hypothetical protein